MDRYATARGRSISWFAGLDGLRAAAVTAVIVFHFAPTVLPGGFLGVDLFFVISGYLITRLLLGEIDQTGRIALRAFYARRIRRLLPAVIALLVVTATASALVWRDELVTMRAGLLASLSYVTNWWLISDHQSYFVAAGRPPMVQHLWSLAIEEQFYLLWPLFLAIVARAYLTWRQREIRRPKILEPRTVHRVAVVAAALAVMSTVAMTFLAVRADVPYGGDSGRVYFGTDTHAMGLLLGATAGALATRGMLPGPPQPIVLRGAFVTDLAAVLALIALARILTGADEFAPWLYRGGFLAISALCTVVVAAAPRRGSAVGWAFDRAPLRWVGRRSYSLYLWHWPVAVVTRPDVDLHLDGFPLFALRVMATFLLAEASYRLVEEPIRADGMRGLARAWGLTRLSAVARARVAAGAVTAAVAMIGILVPVFAGAAPSAERAASNPQPQRVAVATRSTTPPRRTPTPQTSHPRPTAARPSKPTARPTPRTRAGPAPRPTRTPTQTVSAFGDSVMLGAAAPLRARLPNTDVSAVEGRQARDLFAEIARRRAAATLGRVVVIHTGDNGVISPDDLTSTLASLADRRRVIVLTDRVPRDWQGPNNETLHRVVAQFPNARLVDWYAISNTHRDWFYGDGLHLNPAGAAAYASAIVAAMPG